MSSPAEWLKVKLKEAEQEMTEAQQQFEIAQKRAMETRKRFEACSEMLEVANAEQQTPDVEHEGPREIVPRGRRIAMRRSMESQQTVPDQVEELLKSGPLSTAEIRDFLRQQGRKRITTNSVNGALNRHKPTRFIRNKEGKWCIVEKS